MNDRGWTGLFLGIVLVLAACAPTLPGSRSDATWTGAAGNEDFNTPANWSPAAVPTGTATINTANSVHIGLSAPNTSLDSINMTGFGRLTIKETQSLELKGRGLMLCCAPVAQLFVHGSLTGDIDFGEFSGQSFYRTVGGNGTISGNIRQTNGTLFPGSGDVVPVVRTLTLRGNYLLSKQGALIFDVGVGAPTPLLDISGKFTVDGGVLIVGLDPFRKGPITFTAVKAAQGMNGRFRDVQTDDPAYTATAEYRPAASPTEIIVTVKPARRASKPDR